MELPRRQGAWGDSRKPITQRRAADGSALAPWISVFDLPSCKSPLRRLRRARLNPGTPVLGAGFKQVLARSRTAMLSAA